MLLSVHNLLVILTELRCGKHEITRGSVNLRMTILFEGENHVPISRPRMHELGPWNFFVSAVFDIVFSPGTYFMGHFYQPARHVGT